MGQEQDHTQLVLLVWALEKQIDKNWTMLGITIRFIIAVYLVMELEVQKVSQAACAVTEQVGKNNLVGMF